MSHTVYDCSSIAQRTAGLKHAARALAADACVVLPTDTVYGIGADAFSARGVATLLAAKGRSRAMPPPVLIAHAGVLDGLADEVSDDARALAAAFWPGGLTLILHAHPSLGWDLGETHGTVALRVPDDELAQALLIESGPLAVSSANRTGHPAALSAEAAAGMLGDAVEVYLDDGSRPAGRPGTPEGDPVSSTIVDCTGETPLLVRHGAVSLARLRAVVPAVTPADGDEELEDGPAAAPGEPADRPEGSGSHAVREIDPEAAPGPVPAPAPAPADGPAPPAPAQAAAAQGLAASLVARSVPGPAARPAVDQDRTRAQHPAAPGQPRPLPVDEAARLVARGLDGA
ncbi:threonylcarbamoyl-AMP synthase [Kocuria sediminis]|uniref:L-threonylcarbamoyladenylate synthase n=1 Tax=Kocuria sediminis TaxID=1038857 RepID=A0A6N8GHK7_9MICC|nr:threonylcarbamoyl-AMP synthase [Kocuria sediminis]